VTSETIGAENENLFLEKLKKTGSCEDFIKATAMLKEYREREEMSERFTDFMKTKGLPKCAVSPLLCSVQWPLNANNLQFRLPGKMAGIFDCFKEFYGRSSKKTQIIVLHQFGKGELLYSTGSNEFLMQATEYQLALLPLIDGKTGATLQHLMDLTSLPLVEVRVQLCFLIKHKLLLAKNGDAVADSPASWNPTTVVSINTKFNHNTRKFSCITMKADEQQVRASTGASSAEEGDDSTNMSQVEAEKRMDDFVMRTECIIVRVMKTRKNDVDENVFAETAKQLAKFFPVNRPIFKKACEKLVDDGLLKRNKKDLEYIA